MWWLEPNNLIYSVMNVAVSFLKMYRQCKIFAQTNRIYCMGLTTVNINLKRVAVKNAVVMGKFWVGRKFNKG